MIIAVDFDGTIVEHKYPEIGKEIPFAIATLKQLQAERIPGDRQRNSLCYSHVKAITGGTPRFDSLDCP